MMVLLRHSSDCGCSWVVSLCCYWGRLLSCPFPAVNTKRTKHTAELTAAMVADVITGFAHSVSAELAEFRQRLLLDGLSFEGCRRVECVAAVPAWVRLDALPVASNCVLGDGDVVASLRYMLGVCPVATQGKPLDCECRKLFSPGQAMRCKCCQGARTVCHDISVKSGWRACVHTSGHCPDV